MGEETPGVHHIVSRPLHRTDNTTVKHTEQLSTAAALVTKFISSTWLFIHYSFIVGPLMSESLNSTVENLQVETTFNYNYSKEPNQILVVGRKTFWILNVECFFFLPDMWRTFMRQNGLKDTLMWTLRRTRYWKNTTSVVATALTERSWWKDDFMLKHEHLYFWDGGGEFI